MLVGSIVSNNFNQRVRFEAGYKNYSLSNNNLNKDVFLLSTKRNAKNNNGISFRGVPWKLDFIDYGTPLKAKDAIILFDKLKLGNYLDINGDCKDIECQKIRLENLYFLDCVKKSKDKSDFIAYYKNLTGFPNMELVSANIEHEFIKASYKASDNLKDKEYYCPSKYNIAYMGYDGVCSVAKNTAFPGSDIDKAFIILKGTENDTENEKIVSDFKRCLWEITDQRILSYNHDASSFPQVYTLHQIEKIAESLKQKEKTLNLHEKGGILASISPISRFGNTESKYEKFKKNMDTYDEDYRNCNKFYIELCKKYPVSGNWDLNLDSLSRENIYQFGYTLEALVKGKNFTNKPLPEFINNLDSATLINVSQINSLKNKDSKKQKYILRRTISDDFKSWSIDEQYNFIKSIIKASCSVNSSYNDYFNSTEETRFMELMREIGV